MLKVPSNRVLKLFAEAESLARRLATLPDEEDRLLDAEEEVWRRKALVMSELADKAREASLAEIAACLKRNAR